MIFWYIVEFENKDSISAKGVKRFYFRRAREKVHFATTRVLTRSSEIEPFLAHRRARTFFLPPYDILLSVMRTYHASAKTTMYYVVFN